MGGRFVGTLVEGVDVEEAGWWEGVFIDEVSQFGGQVGELGAGGA